MKTLVIVSEKGGTAKSTLANELYLYLRDKGIRTSLYSLDGQYTNPARSIKVEKPDVSVVDTPGVLTDNIAKLVSGADLVIITTRPTPNDIEPFTRTVEIVQKNTEAPVLVVVSGFNRYRVCTSFMRWLRQKPWAANVVTIPQSEAIVQAQVNQTSIRNIVKKGKALEAIQSFCDTALSLAGITDGDASPDTPSW